MRLNPVAPKATKALLNSSQWQELKPSFCLLFLYGALYLSQALLGLSSSYGCRGALALTVRGKDDGSRVCKYHKWTLALIIIERPRLSSQYRLMSGINSLGDHHIHGTRSIDGSKYER